MSVRHEWDAEGLCLKCTLDEHDERAQEPCPQDLRVKWLKLARRVEGPCGCEPCAEDLCGTCDEWGCADCRERTQARVESLEKALRDLVEDIEECSSYDIVDCVTDAEAFKAAKALVK